MKFFTFIKQAISATKNLESGMDIKFRFSQKEINEILSMSKKENLKYFKTLAQMPHLKYFDIAFLLSKTKLSDEKIEIIKEAQKIYNDKEFKESGQTETDFIFRVAANLEHLNMGNIEIFKELVKCKNELYNFKEILESPNEFLVAKEQKLGYAFERIYLN